MCRNKTLAGISPQDFSVPALHGIIGLGWLSLKGLQALLAVWCSRETVGAAHPAMVCPEIVRNPVLVPSLTKVTIDPGFYNYEVGTAHLLHCRDRTDVGNILLTV